MQAFLVMRLLILISLTALTEAQYGDNPGCPSRCGRVSIAYPFGIGRKCSANYWYTVHCNSSTPYLSSLNNVEVLYTDSSTISVNMSVIKADCNNPFKNIINLVQNTSHGKNPFRFSGSNNVFVVKGCGSGAIMENGTVVSGCSTTCRNNTLSDLNNCFGVGCCQTTIPHDLKSFTFNLSGLETKKHGNETCGSAFLVETFYRESISEEHSFAPVSLSWNSNSTRCNYMCGNVMIPYPFGIGKGCYYNKWFNVDCISSTPYLSALNDVQVMGVKQENRTVTINVSVVSNCSNQDHNNYNIHLSESPFSVPKSHNIFVAEGCGSATLMRKGRSNNVTGCSTTCGSDTYSDRKKCHGIGCCQTSVPYDVKSFSFNVTGLKKNGNGNGSCGSAFLVDKNAFMDGRFSSKFVPMTLTWTYNSGNGGTEDFCARCQRYGGRCYYTYFSGLTCNYNDFDGREESSHSTGVILGISLSIGTLLLTGMSFALYKTIKKTKVKRRKQRCFKRNGGLLLKQQEATDIGLVDKTILFTSNELEKATNHFNENRVIGRGGQGTVYKGMLADGKIVAIKKSKVVDESQLEQFINEVVILSQVNHRNVVRLLGCCLETEVPLLVSEFIPNGTLYDLIQDENGEFPISLKMRLQIATEVAGAVSYLHSATSIPIYHRDIKTTNILMDEKYRAKVSDFGTSRFVSIDQTHLTTLVKGTFGYLDPEYFQSSQFTEKSDVYSFGVVLLELMTSEKPLSLTRFGENRSLATHFITAMEEGRVMSIFDAMVVKEGSRNELLALANLAMRCLNFSGKNRPTMKQVFIELEGIRLSHVPSTVENNFAYVELRLTYGESTSTSTIFDHTPNAWVEDKDQNNKIFSIPACDIPACNCHPESVNHIFLTCSTTKILMAHLKTWCPLLPNIDDCLNAASLFQDVSKPYVSTAGKYMIEVILRAFVWVVWCNRNNIVFRSCISIIPSLVFEVKNHSYLWLKYRSKHGKDLSLDNWMLSGVGTLSPLAKL
ncbi:hypothetical protein LXL04_014231 [Taraxacum kok-saghyz]